MSWSIDWSRKHHSSLWEQSITFWTQTQTQSGWLDCNLHSWRSVSVISCRLLNCPQAMVAGFSQSKQSEENRHAIKAEAAVSLVTWPWKSYSIISAMPYWPFGSALFNVWAVTPQGCECPKVRTIEGHLGGWLPQVFHCTRTPSQWGQ